MIERHPSGARLFEHNVYGATVVYVDAKGKIAETHLHADICEIPRSETKHVEENREEMIDEAEVRGCTLREIIWEDGEFGPGHALVMFDHLSPPRVCPFCIESDNG